MYICKVYVFIKFKGDPDKLGKFQKLAPKTYIGYLVGYKSTSIYRVWIPYKKKVISVRDMIFNKEAFFDSKPTKIIIELITALDKIFDLVKVQLASDFEDIQL